MAIAVAPHNNSIITNGSKLPPLHRPRRKPKLIHLSHLNLNLKHRDGRITGMRTQPLHLPLPNRRKGSNAVTR